MDYRRINSHIILLGMVIVVGLFAAIIVRMSMLKSGADAGTANLVFILILGASSILYLIIVSTLSNSVIPWIMKRLPAPKEKAGDTHSDDPPEYAEDDESGCIPDYSFAYPDLVGYGDSGGEEICSIAVMSFIEAGVMSIKQGICVLTSNRVCSFIAPALRLCVARLGAGANRAIQRLPNLGRERIAMGQLPEDHHQHLVPAAEIANVFIAAILADYVIETIAIQKPGYLAESVFVLIHSEIISISQNYLTQQ